MKITALAIIALALLASCKPAVKETMPVTGTFINLAWQDERNNYMNFQDENVNTDPEMWADKMRALHEIGVDYIMFDQVANERKAYYPSPSMEHHYPEGRKSPVDAIMDTCDELGMHVFLSSGWAVSQYDNVGDSSVVARQCEIMQELADLYGDRPSFCGWYLPMEDCLSPYLPDRSVDGINKLTATAYAVTPGKLTMVAPWGIYGAQLDNPKFKENLSRINVDIIAYQDEVGCVRDRFPMIRVRRNFRKLEKIHKDLKLEYWINIENFTWDRGTNNHYSSLIPAEFGRYLAQIVNASQSGCRRIVSFSIFGIIDKPGERHPLSQPVEGPRTWSDYQSWLDGDAHWSLLEDVFTSINTGKPYGKAVNDAHGARVCYSVNGLPSRKLSAAQSEIQALTDGVFGEEDPTDPRWVDFTAGMNVTLDLGRTRSVSSVAPRFLNYAQDHIHMPGTVVLETSVDGENWSDPVIADGPHAVNIKHDCYSDLTLFENVGDARYVRISVQGSLWSRRLCDEIIIRYDR
ncbi:MAG: DUF4434 domain-containing protein [Bacteroidales bacterium]|nr:DUF4434 domain-containing protein [Bacteroidales bacterium]